ncbi:fimbrial biogenesis chaperone [Acinetobacter populi]|uniref:Molecular chaperone n=1 Tax=Acinetobacter populi TaxID=1582270 RepID=A0A1Z9Z2H8_9GAMM|nr:molecular chaperone [Acinetobacter populi]OUY08665.1 hypothetical protein CAP51_03375 [Acinetobacter populi]
MKKFGLKLALFLLFTPVCWFEVHASVILDTTRLIYNDTDKEVSLHVFNSGTYPVLLQSWIDAGNIKSTPEDMDVPFLITPPITRIDSKESQTLRIRYIGRKHDKNQETVYWLNVLEVPPKSDSSENELNVAYRTRIKLFLRPEILKSLDLSTLVKAVKWNIIGNKLNIINSTPFNISLVDINLESNGDKFDIPGEMIYPYSSKLFEYNLSNKVTKSNLKVTLNYLNDFGGLNSALISSD